MQQSLFQRHDFSGHRRLFAAGDIHGCFDLLQQQLDELEFDATQDAIVLLGDLVDRGEFNEAALEFIDRPGVYRVRGNHEHLLHRAVVGSAQSQLLHVRNGGNWFLNIDDPELRDRWSDAMTACPLAIEAISPAGRKIGFVHADVPTESWDDLELALETAPDLTARIGAAWDCMWSRDRIKALVNHISQHGSAKRHTCHVPGVDHVFFGHTIVREPLVHDNCSWIDTGAYSRDNLTIVNVDQWVENQENR